MALNVMEPEDLTAEFKRGEISPVYLLAGSDGFRSERTARWLAAKSVDAESADFNSQTIYADEASPAAMAEAASAYPMFGNQRFVWVRHAEQLPSGAAIEPLLRYLDNPAPSTVMVFTASKLDKRLKFTTGCAKHGRVVSFAPLAGGGLIAQLRRQAKECGLRITDDGLAQLTDLVGDDLGELHHELEKLALHAGEESLDGSQVHELVSRSRDIDAFALADRLDPRRPFPALDVWFDLRGRGGDAMGCAAILSWRLRQLAQLRGAIDANVPEPGLGKAVGMAPWQARRVLPLAKAHSTRRLGRALTAFRDADRLAKSSTLGVEAFDLAMLDWALAPEAAT